MAQFVLPIKFSVQYYSQDIVIISTQVRSAAADQFNRLCKDVSVLGGMQKCYIVTLSMLRCSYRSESEF